MVNALLDDGSFRLARLEKIRTGECEICVGDLCHSTRSQPSVVTHLFWDAAAGMGVCRSNFALGFNRDDHRSVFQTLETSSLPACPVFALGFVRLVFELHHLVNELS